MLRRPAAVIAVIAGSAGPYRVPGQNLHFGASKLYLRSISAAREIIVLVENINLEVIYVRQKSYICAAKSYMCGENLCICGKKLYVCGEKLYVRHRKLYVRPEMLYVRGELYKCGSYSICAASIFIY